MAETKLRTNLEVASAEISGLKQRVSPDVPAAPTAPAVHKDLSLISLVPKWSGAENSVPLEEFLSCIERASKIGRWDETDLLQVAILRLADPAKTFYNTCLELQAPDTTWQTFKNVFKERFKDSHTDQYHFMQLQTAKQQKGESPQTFADRCRMLAQKVMRRDGDAVAQRIHRENAERMCLASFVAGLVGNAGKFVRFSNPSNMSQALATAQAVTEAERHEKSTEIFYTGLENSGESSSRKSRENRNSRRSADARATAKHQESTHHTPRKGLSKATSRCFECEGWGHFAKECPTRLKREGRPPDSPGRKNPSGRSKRPNSPGRKPQRTTERGNSKETERQGNE